jgi:hypothetical protein
MVDGPGTQRWWRLPVEGLVDVLMERALYGSAYRFKAVLYAEPRCAEDAPIDNLVIVHERNRLLQEQPTTCRDLVEAL